MADAEQPDQPAGVADLMAALEASLEAVKGGREDTPAEPVVVRQIIDRRCYAAGLADQVLQAAGAGEEPVASYVAWLRSEGVTAADFRDYWNLSPQERATVDRVVDALVSGSYLSEIKHNGGDKDAAVSAVAKRLPFYGEPVDDERTGVTGDDRRLPIELEHRVDQWARRKAVRPRKLRAMMNDFSSFNALVRAEIRAGRL